MSNSELMAYIAKQKSAGVAPEEIVKNLKSVGWSDQDINEAMGGGVEQAEPAGTKPNMALKGVFDLLKETWGQFMMQWKTLLGISLFPTVVGIVLGIPLFAIEFISGFSESPDSGMQTISGFIELAIRLIVAGIGIWAQIALIMASVNPAMGARQALKQSYRLLPAYAWIALLVSLGSIAGTLLFIIPGVIVSVWWMFSHYVLVGEHLRGTKALGRSRAYVRGRWWKVVGRMIGFGVLMVAPILLVIAFGGWLYFSGITGVPIVVSIIVGVVLLMAYSVFAGPFGILYVSALYRSLKQQIV
ncbi:hypothetical protein HZA86_02955 [Candidatus Uhrbacteria bacterium]|nr:hypothetical protein [Candidatus Uhrbacteria bacterium]